MTPADLANTIAAARDGAQHLGGDGWKARQVLWEMGYRTLAVDGMDIEAGIRAAERYLALWQRLEMEHRMSGVAEGHDCSETGPAAWCYDTCQALAQAAEKLQEALDG